MRTNPRVNDGLEPSLQVVKLHVLSTRSAPACSPVAAVHELTWAWWASMSLVAP